MPNLVKMGYEIIAFRFLAFTEAKAESLAKAREWGKRQLNIVFASEADGLGINSTIVSVHKKLCELLEVNNGYKTGLAAKFKEYTEPHLEHESSRVDSEAIFIQIS
jgi:hypothetical protein